MWSLDPRYSFKDLDASVLDSNARAIQRLKSVPFPSNVWLYSDPGLGKTHLAKCALNRHQYRGYDVDAVVGLEFRAIGEQFPRDREDDQRRLIAPALLLIDDIDKIEMTGKALESLWYVLHCRYMAGKRNIITSNMEAKALGGEWKRVRGINQTMLTATLDRFNPCVQFQINGEKSLRHTHAPKPTARPMPLDTVSEFEAARIRKAGMNLGALQQLGAMPGGEG